MNRLNRNVLATAAALAALGAGGCGGEGIDNSPNAKTQLEQVIKPRMEKLGKLTIKLAERSREQFSTPAYDAEDKTVTIAAENQNEYGSDAVEAVFAVKPGTQKPDPNRILSIKVSNQQEAKGVKGDDFVELTAPGVASDLGFSRDANLNAYGASESGGIDFESDASLGGPYYFDTRDKEHFIDNEWPDYKKTNPVPTAKHIVKDDGVAASTIRSAFEG